MAVTLAQAFAIVASELNATTTGRNAASLSTAVDDDRHPKKEIEEVILQSDMEVVRAVIQTPGHPRRNQFINRVEIAASGDELPQATEGWSNVECFNGSEWITGNARSINVIQRINRRRAIYGGATKSASYFDISDGRAYFTGEKIRVDTYRYIRTNECQSPDEYLSTVVNLSLGWLMHKEGDDVAAGQFYRQIGENQLQMIRARQFPNAWQSYLESNAQGRV